MHINGSLVTDEHKISEYVSKFYQLLYSSSFIPYSVDFVFKKVSLFLDTVTEECHKNCKSVPMLYMDMIIKRTPFNKSPGPDSLPSEFYRTFWQENKNYEARTD